MAESISTGGYQIGEHESFPLEGLTDRASDRSREDGTRPGERMKLSPLAAGIDVLGKLPQKAGIEFPPREPARNDFRVQAGDRGTKTKRSFTVVTRAVTSIAGWLRRTWRVRALVLPATPP